MLLLNDKSFQTMKQHNIMILLILQYYDILFTIRNYLQQKISIKVYYCIVLK